MPRHIGLLCAGVALFGFGATARAEEGVAIKNLLGQMGLIAQDKDAIRYRERAPLVLPPKMELREPASPENVASNRPDWPQDPDVMVKKRRVAEQRIPVTESEVRRMSENNPRLSIYEMRQGRNPDAEGAGPPVHRGDSARDALLLSPDELRAGAKKDDETGGGTTVRRTLTDPPTAFRKSAGGGAVTSTYTPRVDQQELDANPINWLRRQFSKGDDDE